MRIALVTAVAVAGLAGAAIADDVAKPKPRPVPVPVKPPAVKEIGITAAWRFVPTNGFVDDPIATDGKRLAFAVADTARAELHAVDLATGTELAPPIDLSAVSTKPLQLAWVGDHVLVVGTSGEAQHAFLVDLDGKDGKGKPLKTPFLHKTPTADRATFVVRDGKPVVALYKLLPIKTGNRHTVELRAADTGKRVGAVKSIDVDAANKSAKLDFTINHWTDGNTRAVGRKGGVWVKAENQRSPDVEAVYDVPAGKFVSTKDIPDLMENRTRFSVLEAAGGKELFVKQSADLTELELWQGGVKTVLALDQPHGLYDAARSFDVAPGPRGPWIALQIDPVNAEAVKKQKADVEYWDLFEVEGAKATRRARIWAGGTRYRFGFAGDKLWVIDRNVGFDRGGKSLAVYALTP
jgi:hypothetical protein